MMILEQINGNLFGFLPEPLGMLIFGFGLVFLTIVLRRIFNRKKEAEKAANPLKPQIAPGKSLKEKLS